jgi:hypothetical protein
VARPGDDACRSVGFQSHYLTQESL